MLTAHSSAKINLTLDVLSRRDDGYHELRSVVHTVGLWDTLHFDFDGEGFAVECVDARLTGADNLILKAARAWSEAAEKNGHPALRSLRVVLEKNIPLGAGMGGGSGNAAATLLALNSQHGDLLSPAELLEVAAKIGADVPLFLQGGCLLMEGIGEKLTALPSLGGWLVILQGPTVCSTPEIFRAWDALAVESGRASEAMLAGALNLNYVAATLGNDLTLAAQAAGFDVTPLRELLLERGALGAQMTGSGSAVFGIFAHEIYARAVAKDLDDRREAFGLGFVAAVPFCNEAVRFTDATQSGL